MFSMMDDDQGIKLSLGCIFTPTDEDLLEHYLKPKVYGQKLPCNIVKEKRIYGPNANPWHVFDASSTEWIGSGNSKKNAYAFTRLTKETVLMFNKKKSCGVGREQHVRKAGCGTWHGKTGRSRKVMIIIGFKRLLIFEIDDVSSLGDGVDLDNVGYWTMHEYCLYGNEDYVVCQIILDTSKKAKVVTLSSKTVSSCSTKPGDDRKIVSPLARVIRRTASNHEDYIVQEQGEGNHGSVTYDHKYQVEIYGMKTDYDPNVLTICDHNSIHSDGLESQENANKGLLECDGWGNHIVEEQVYDQGCLAGMIGFWTRMIYL